MRNAGEPPRHILKKSWNFQELFISLKTFKKITSTILVTFQGVKISVITEIWGENTINWVLFRIFKDDVNYKCGLDQKLHLFMFHHHMNDNGKYKLL